MSDLSKLKKTELLALVEEAGLTADADATKADLIALLEAPAEAPAEVVAEVVAEAPKKASKKSTKVDMALDGLEFVKGAYLAILKRDADAGGLESYGQALMFGTMSKEALVEELSNCAEAKAL